MPKERIHVSRTGDFWANVEKAAKKKKAKKKAAKKKKAKRKK